MDEAGFPPITVKPVPVIAAAEMLTAAVPVLVMLKLCVALLPTATFPKLKLEALGERIPAPWFCNCPPGLVYPAQLERPMTTSTTAIGEIKANRLCLSGFFARIGPGTF